MRNKALAAALLTGAVALSACGTRVDRSAELEATGAGASPASLSGGTSSDPTAPPGSLASSSIAAAEPGGGENRPTSGAPGAGGATPGRSPSGTGRSSSPGAAAGGSEAPIPAPQPGTSERAAGKAGQPGSGASQPDKPGLPDTAAPPGPRSEVLIGSVGTYSGPIGTVVLPGLKALQVWVRWINDRGGVNGHPVRLLAQDDGGDPARHRAQVQAMVERDKVTAFVFNGDPVTGRSSIDYITARRVPVVGGSNGEEWYYDSPMFFPQSSHGSHVVYNIFSTAARQLLPKGQKKLGIVACVEADPCAVLDREGPGWARSVGFDFAYKARVSLVEPDYTAQCLAARNAGAQVVVVVLDINSIRRLGASCARQGYRPTFASASAIVDDSLGESPWFDGMVASFPLAPSFLPGIAGVDEFGAALARYAPDLRPGPGTVNGWSAGKLFERSAAALGEPPTSDAILRGLWNLRDDTLGGLTYPLTFRPNEPARPRRCSFAGVFRGGRCTSPDNGAMHCAD